MALKKRGANASNKCGLAPKHAPFWGLTHDPIRLEVSSMTVSGAGRSKNMRGVFVLGICRKLTDLAFAAYSVLR